MTKYLNPQPFSAPVSAGNLTAEEYFLRVGALIRCEACDKNVSSDHKCPCEYTGIMYVPKEVAEEMMKELDSHKEQK